MEKANSVNEGLRPMKNAKEICEVLRISRQSLWVLRKAGKLSAVVINNKLRFTDEEIERFIRDSSENQNLVEG